MRAEVPSLEINGRRIAADMPPYIIAEMSANHNGKINNAFDIILEAKKSGADAVKLQTYSEDTITINCDTEDFQIKDGLWDGMTLYQLYQQAHMPWEWHKPLFDLARDIDLTIFSSPFDKTAVDLLEDLNAPAYKIASFEAVDLPLIEYVASTKKPIIISMGMATLDEIEEAIDVARQGGCRQLAILHCVSAYPASADDCNLRTIPDLINKFGLVTGLSDHTLDSTAAIASVCLGASIIEKHFTLDRNGGGADDSFSIEPSELSALCYGSKTAWKSLGRVSYGPKPSEVPNLKFRRSLYFVKDKKVGEIVTENCIRSIRPGFGLPPRYYSSIIGKRLRVAVSRGTATHADQFED